MVFTKFQKDQLKKMMCVAPARTGRQLQRYNQNYRQVVGCIPYRYKNVGINNHDELEVLVISSKKTPRSMMFPKGGWEMDESVEEAACRESLEEAGVVGNLQCELGRWIFKSKSRDSFHEGFMFPLLVTDLLDLWPEKPIRFRQWMSVEEAREACGQWWMKEALDKFVDWITNATITSSSSSINT